MKNVSKQICFIALVAIMALAITAPVYSGGSQNERVVEDFTQDYSRAYYFEYPVGMEKQRILRVQQVDHGPQGSIYHGGSIQFVKAHYAGPPNIVQIMEVFTNKDKSNYVPDAKKWEVGDTTSVEGIMIDNRNVRSYRIYTPANYFVEFATFNSSNPEETAGRKFGVILPGSAVVFYVPEKNYYIDYGAIGYDDDFAYAGDLDSFMKNIAEMVDYEDIKSNVEATKAAFNDLKAKGITNKCPSTPPCACRGDINKHIVHAASLRSALWGGLWGAVPPWLLPLQLYKVRAQFAAQAELAASIGYLNGYFPRGGEDFHRRLKIDNYVLFTGHGIHSLGIEGVILNFIKEEIIDIEAVSEAMKAFQEDPTTDASRIYYESVMEDGMDYFKDQLEEIIQDKMPKLISWIPVVGTLWDMNEGAYEGIDEARDMGLRAIEYYSKPREFYFEEITSTITAYIGSNVNVTIPDRLPEKDGKKVLVLGAKSFQENQTIESVTLYKNVTTIEAEAFSLCPQLTTVTLGEDIKTIGNWAFLHCPQLTTVNIPSNIKKITIGKDAFYGTNLDYATKLRLRKLGYTGAGVGEGFFIVNNTGKTIAIVEMRVGSGWLPLITKNVRNGKDTAVDLAPGTYDLRARTTTKYPAGDIYEKWGVTVTDDTTEVFIADDIKPLERADYKVFIQARCSFSNPSDVWAVIDTHAFPDAIYKTWAESYPYFFGIRFYPYKRPGKKTDQQIIQSLCKFSSPQAVWDVVDTHPYPDALLKVWADSYYNEGGIVDGIVAIIKNLLGGDDNDDNGDSDEIIAQITPVSVGDYRPATLPTNATFQQALEKLDEIIAFCEANPSSANNTARDSCNGLREMWETHSDNLEPLWSIGASTNINAINWTIASLDSGTMPQIAPSEAGTFKLTGIPSQYNGKYAVAVGGGNIGPFNDTIAIIGAQDYIRYPTSTTAAPIRGGQVAMNLWTVERLLQSPYRGNHSLSVIIYIVDEASGEDFDEAEHYIGFESVAFRNGGATMAWRDGIVDGVYSSTDPGTFTLTGIPSQYNGKYAMIDAEAAGVIGLQTIAMAGGEPIMTTAPIRSGRAAINLWRATPVGFAPYKGSDTFKVTVMIYNQGTVTAAEADYITEELSVEFANVSFRNGVATLAWNAGTVQEGPPPVTHTYSSEWSFDETQHWHDCTDRDGAKSGVGNHTSAAACTVCGYWQWTIVEDNPFGGINIRSIAYGNNRFVAGTHRGLIAYSADGVSWTAVEDRPFGSDSTYGSSAIIDIAYGNGRFVAVGGNGKMTYSADGVSWTVVAPGTSRDSGHTFGTTGIAAITYGNNRFVAGGGDGKMAYSTDGVSWTAVADSTFGTTQINAIAWGNNRFVAGGNGGKMAYSADGQSWTAIADSAFGDSGINAVAWGNNRWVAVGSNGKMAYSADGVRWTAVADSGLGNYHITDVAWGNGRFVTGRYVIAYSTDGVRWTVGTKFSISSIAYANGRFVAGSDYGRIAYTDW